MAEQADPAHRALVAEGFALSRSKDATVKQAEKWLRREKVAIAIMGRDAYNDLVKEMADAMWATGKSPWSEEDDR